MDGKVVDRPEASPHAVWRFRGTGPRDGRPRRGPEVGKQFGHAVGLSYSTTVQGAASNAVSRFWRPFLWGKNPSNRNRSWQTRGHQAPAQRRWRRAGLDVDAGLHAGANQQESGRKCQAFRRRGTVPRSPHLPAVDHARQSTVLVVLVKRPKWGVDAKVAQGFPVVRVSSARTAWAFSTSKAGASCSPNCPQGGHHNEFATTHDTKVRTMRLANASCSCSTSASSPLGDRVSWNMAMASSWVRAAEFGKQGAEDFFLQRTGRW